jgi:hypothetical protein
MRDVLVKEHTHVRPRICFWPTIYCFMSDKYCRPLFAVCQLSGIAGGNSPITISRVVLGSLASVGTLFSGPDIHRPACRHDLKYRHDRDKQGDGHGRVNFGDVVWGDRPDRGCHPGCGALQTRTSQESATSLAGHTPYTRLVTPQALTQAGTKSPARSGADQAKPVNGSGFASGRVPSLCDTRDDVDDRRRVQVRLR